MDRVLLDFGSVKIYWYSIMILLGIIIGIILATKEARRVGLSSVLISDLSFYILPISIIGARIYYVAFNFQEYQNNILSIFKVWEGGIAIYGGIIAGIIFIMIYCHKKELNLLRTLDIFAPSLILAQAIGRWGNFFNGEAYGPKTTIEFLQKLHLPDYIINGMYIENGVSGTGYYQPTFLYESIWCILGFILLILIRYLYKKNKIGNLTFIYFIWYGIGRLLIEALRQDSLYMGTFRVSQIVSIVLIVIGIIGLITSKKRQLYKNDTPEEIKEEKEVLFLG